MYGPLHVAENPGPDTVRLRGSLGLTLRRIRRYWVTFGLLPGLSLYFRIFYGARGTTRLRVPGYIAPIYLRRRTSDAKVFQQVFLARQYDLPLRRADPRLIVDAGANVGYSAVFFARRYPGARVLAIEPEPSNFELLVRNTEPYPGVVPINAALWNTRSRLRIENPGDENWAFRVAEEISQKERPAVVDSVTMADLLAMTGEEEVGVLKLDIEGAEKELFSSGHEDWLGTVQAIAIELHDRLRPGCSTSFYRATSQYNFRQHINNRTIILVRCD